MAQNIYDDPEFLAGYVTLDRQVRGLDGAAEWPAMRAMVPDVAGSRVVDLGCGFGWLSRWTHDQGAAGVVGIDVSAKMLARARADTASDLIEYRRVDLDQLELPPESVDLAISSLSLHYVGDLDRLMRVIAGAMTSGGALVFSVEHPIYSAPTTQAFELTESGRRVWPLDNYLVEGERVTRWFVDGVVKQHRTVASYVNSAIAAGFRIDRIEEWSPTTDEDRHRPWFLLIAATRATARTAR